MTKTRSKTWSIAAYSNEIRKIPLLSAEQEQDLAQQLKLSKQILEVKANLWLKLGQAPTLSEWAQACNLTVRELNFFNKKYELAREQLIQANLRLVLNLAWKYVDKVSNLDLCDLVQEGNIGLAKAVDKFNPDLGHRFSTYAYWWIRQAITRSIQERDSIVRLPHHIHDRMAAIAKARQKLNDNKTPVTIESLARVSQLSTQEVKQIEELSCQALSLDCLMGDASDSCLGDIIFDEREDPENYANANLLRDALRAEIARKLTDKERQAIVLYFGLEDGISRSLEAVGKEMGGISRERVRQIKQTGLSKLQRSQIFKNYCDWN